MANLTRSISRHAVHAQHFVNALLCRSAQLTAGGRTRSALVIGLGDEGVMSNNVRLMSDLSPNSSIIVYGQLDPNGEHEHGHPVPLKLLVARKRTRRSTDVLPGEPLPRGGFEPARELK